MLGIVPLNWLPWRSRNCRLVLLNWLRSGIGPVNWFSRSSRYLRLVSLLSEAGIAPLNWLFHIRRSVRLVRRPRSGMLPVKWLSLQRQLRQLVEVAQLGRQRPAQVVIPKGQVCDAAVAVRVDAVPVLDRYSAPPVGVGRPALAVRAVVQRHQHDRVRYRRPLADHQHAVGLFHHLPGVGMGHLHVDALAVRGEVDLVPRVFASASGSAVPSASA